MSLNRAPLAANIDKKEIQSGSLVICDTENVVSEGLKKEKLVAHLTDISKGPKFDKLYNQKAQLAVNLSTELYKAKKILKDVIGSQSNRKRSQSK